MPYQFSGDVVTLMLWVMCTLKNKPLVTRDVCMVHNKLITQMNIDTGVDLIKKPEGFQSESISSFLKYWDDNSGLSNNRILTKEGLKFAVLDIITTEALINPMIFGEVSKFIRFELPTDFFEMIQERP